MSEETEMLEGKNKEKENKKKARYRVLRTYG